MSNAQIPTDAPPAYEEAASDSSRRPQRNSANLEVPEDERSTLSPEQRRSFEDEQRPLPEGWIRLYDQASEHQFFVHEPTGRSIWVHPYDDEQWQQEEADRAKREGRRSEAEPKLDPNRKKGFGEKMKEKVTGQTKEERAAERKKRIEAEKRAEQEYLRRREEMRKQMMAQYGPMGPGQTVGPGPMYGRGAPMMYGRPGGGMYGPPGMAYGRRGGGMGMGAPLLGGLAGGMLLGGALGGMDGGFGGGF